MKLLKFVLFVCLLLPQISPARSGHNTTKKSNKKLIDGDSAHGGHVVSCGGKDTVILDYYHASLPSLDDLNPAIIDLESVDVIEYTRNIFNGADITRLDWHEKYRSGITYEMMFDAAIKRVGPIRNWVLSPLNLVPDYVIPYRLLSDCFAKQAAVRQNESQFLDLEVYESISNGQRKLLVLHEVLYLLLQDVGVYTSDKVLTFLRTILNQNMMRDYNKAVLTFFKIMDDKAKVEKAAEDAIEADAIKRSRGKLHCTIPYVYVGGYYTLGALHYSNVEVKYAKDLDDAKKRAREEIQRGNRETIDRLVLNCFSAKQADPSNHNNYTGIECTERQNIKEACMIIE